MLLALVAPPLTGCTTDKLTTGSIDPVKADASNVSAKERQCLIRAMYFESNRSSDDGLLAVGSVVMNRVASPKFPDTICGVVSQPHQFARGVMTRKMSSKALPRVEKIADEILAGKRHKKVGTAKYFHTAGLHFHYHNMHYVAVAGGNAFYMRTSRHATVTAAVDTNTMPVPAARPDNGLPGVTTAYSNPSEIDARISEAFAAVTN
ncbi:MAG TPA: cell wall hydrolase [Pararhizobium sp.]|nr:cell wall hydrolase [Pararhizobium sp.]